MALKHVRKTYEKLGEKDPLFAVLSFREAKGNQWDPEAFFARGRNEISAALDRLSGLGLEIPRSRALDFGCGVGRLTQALCEEFEEVVGVDISSTMIEAARGFNRFGERCRYIVNTTDRLGVLDDASFDFIYSNITLQHIPPEASACYIGEFIRLLRPGGVALFQIPSGPRHDPGSFGARLYSIRKGPLKRFWKRLRGKPPVEIHYLNQSIVEEIVAAAGGRLIEARQDGSVRRSRVSMFYTVTRH
jgi:ubiquinone/menaquinone biosynthesis C-methylase UbiE